jgi:hypothetical protein
MNRLMYPPGGYGHDPYFQPDLPSYSGKKGGSAEQGLLHLPPPGLSPIGQSWRAVSARVLAAHR